MVQAVILAIDAGHQRLSLGIKQLQPDAWETFFQQHNVNDVVSGKVLRLAGFGAFIEVADGVEALCHFSEVPGWSGRKTEPSPLSPGQEMQFKIVKMNEVEKKIGLSLKAVDGSGQRTAAAGAGDD
jgi:small subunit ribosomal protein S1